LEAVRSAEIAILDAYREYRDAAQEQAKSTSDARADSRKKLAETVLEIERAIYQVQMSQLEAYSRVSDKLKTTYQTIQQIIGGRLDQGVQDAISRLGSMGVASNQLIRTASRRGDNEIVLKLNWSGDTPEAARKAAVDWLLPTLQRAAGAGGAVAH